MGRKSTAIGAAVFALGVLPAAASASSVQALGVISGPNLITVQAEKSNVFGTFGAVQFLATADNTVQIRGTVACMTVSGNQAYVVYRDTLASPFGSAGGYVRMIDNGPAGVTPVDEQNNGRFALSALNKEISKGCPIPTSGIAFHPTHVIDSGEIIVTP
jgi:hypothetical protein